MDPRDPNVRRTAAAYHEAGHAVVAYWFGWWLNDEGVEIDDRWYTGCRKLVLDNTVEAQICQAMAGWLSEHKWHGLGSDYFGDENALYGLYLARNYNPHDPDDFEFEEAGDIADIALMLYEADSEITDEEFLKALAPYRERARKILDEAEVWRAIEKLAAALLASGKLSDEEARAAIGDEPIFGRGVSACSPWQRCRARFRGLQTNRSWDSSGQAMTRCRRSRSRWRRPAFEGRVAIA
jgi:hypothetical protein